MNKFLTAITTINVIGALFFVSTVMFGEPTPKDAFMAVLTLGGAIAGIGAIKIQNLSTKG
jgi:hypothetical protein